MTITRKTERRRATRNTAIVTIAISVLAHLLVLAVFVPGWLERIAEEPLAPPEREELEIEAVYEEPPAEAPAPTPEPQPPNELAQEPELSPEISDATSPQAMMVESRPQDAEPQPPETVEPPPAPPAEEAEPMLEEQSPVVIKRPRPSARALLMPSTANYEEVFADADEDARERAREHARGEVLFRDYERNAQGVRDALRSFGHEVNPGNHTGVDPQSGAFGSYIGLIHRKIHGRWAHGYLMDLDLSEPAGSPMNDPTLNTKLELVIRATDGELEAVNIVRSSGQVRFDAQAIATVHAIGPNPNPPPEVVSPDGRVYVHWNFWRDQRQCGTFGASIFIVAERGASPG